MIIKTKYKTRNGPRRVKNQVHIEEIILNENMISPKDEKFEIAFRNNSTSGLIEFRPDEMDRLIRTIKDKTNLIKGFKIIRD